MKISPELLSRFHAGSCSEGEEAYVLHWLNQEEECLQVNFPEHEDPLLVRKIMWQRIRERIIQRRAIKPFLAAASTILVLGACIFALLGNKPQVIHFENASTAHNRSFYVNAMVITLGPESTCEVETKAKGDERRISFSGAMSIKNRYTGKMKIQVVAKSKGGSDGGEDYFSLQGGQTYMIMNDQHYNLIAATNDELEDGLPMIVKSKLTKVFSL